MCVMPKIHSLVLIRIFSSALGGYCPNSHIILTLPNDWDNVQQETFGSKLLCSFIFSLASSLTHPPFLLRSFCSFLHSMSKAERMKIRLPFAFDEDSFPPGKPPGEKLGLIQFRWDNLTRWRIKMASLELSYLVIFYKYYVNVILFSSTNSS